MGYSPKWTPQEDSLILLGYLHKLSYADIQEDLDNQTELHTHRTIKAIKARCYLLRKEASE